MVHEGMARAFIGEQLIFFARFIDLHLNGDMARI